MLEYARPELVEFLETVRKTGNEYWARHKPESLEDFRARGVGGSTWDENTRWMARFADRDIDALERQHGVDFPADYRAFLAILGGTDRPALRYGFEGAALKYQGKRYVFPDWLDDAVLTKPFNSVLEDLLFDVEKNNIWLDSWGARPDTPDDRRRIVAGLMDRAPKVIPVHGHRFMVAGAEQSPAPVLSGVQSDFILYASSIEDVLIRDFPDLCGGRSPRQDDANC